MDVHVPAAITRGLVLRGVDVLTAQLDGAAELEHPDLLDRASELGRVLFSQDEVFEFINFRSCENENLGSRRGMAIRHLSGESTR